MGEIVWFDQIWAKAWGVEAWAQKWNEDEVWQLYEGSSFVDRQAKWSYVNELNKEADAHKSELGGHILKYKWKSS